MCDGNCLSRKKQPERSEMAERESLDAFSSLSTACLGNADYGRRFSSETDQADTRAVEVVLPDDHCFKNVCDVC